MGKKTTNSALLEIINSLSEQGIQADRNHLIEDIGAQFADYREWIREYVVNSFDAGATWCHVSGKQDEDVITIFVEDNGHGVNEGGVRDFMTLFRSAKKGDLARNVGRFGVGKACVIAISGLVGFT